MAFKTKHPEIDLVGLQRKLKHSIRGKTCLHPGSIRNECRGRIVNSHSISRSAYLAKIADNGQVITFRDDIFSCLIHEKNPQPIKVGLSKASIFPGFCEKHDAETFASIDKPNFSLTDKNIFLLTYRSLCQAIFAKQCEHDLPQIMRETMPEADIILGDYFAVLEMSTRNGEEGLLVRKAIMDECLIGQNWELVKYYGIRCRGKQEMVCSALVSIYVDLGGRVVQDPEDNVPFMVGTYFHYLPHGDDLVFMVSWDDESFGVNRRIIRSFHGISDLELGDAALCAMFQYSDNIYLRPAWWDALAPSVKVSITNRMYNDAGLMRRYRCFRHAWVALEPWSGIRRYSNSLHVEGLLPF